MSSHVAGLVATRIEAEAMKKKILLGLFMTAVIVEILAITDNEDGNTITELNDKMTKRHGAIWPFSWGVAAGHLFWSGREK
jgi:hypothetical protein